MAKTLTHGEAWFLWYQSIAMVDGAFVATLKIKIPPPMTKEEAGEYYNKKLFAYWMTQLCDDIPVAFKAEAVSLMMFGNPDKAKLFKA